MSKSWWGSGQDQNSRFRGQGSGGSEDRDQRSGVRGQWSRAGWYQTFSGGRAGRLEPMRASPGPGPAGTERQTLIAPPTPGRPEPTAAREGTTEGGAAGGGVWRPQSGALEVSQVVSLTRQGFTGGSLTRHGNRWTEMVSGIITRPLRMYETVHLGTMDTAFQRNMYQNQLMTRRLLQTSTNSVIRYTNTEKLSPRAGLHSNFTDLDVSQSE